MGKESLLFGMGPLQTFALMFPWFKSCPQRASGKPQDCHFPTQQRPCCVSTKSSRRKAVACCCAHGPSFDAVSAASICKAGWRCACGCSRAPVTHRPMPRAAALSRAPPGGLAGGYEQSPALAGWSLPSLPRRFGSICRACFDVA